MLAASSAGPTPDSDYAPPAYSPLGINRSSSLTLVGVGEEDVLSKENSSNYCYDKFSFSIILENKDLRR